ncbi:3229_t:CDS:2 [Diversispora eburnea]|uniref:3229_t:CDS:1 n=1 Tax=Diversispora eburnea TaxID=1213867 RepID=A0A9N8ZXW7_9GLOM|nr:3229_t:CDS:2 [Diversispora eburnea]
MAKRNFEIQNNNPTLALRRSPRIARRKLNARLIAQENDQESKMENGDEDMNDKDAYNDDSKNITIYFLYGVNAMMMLANTSIYDGDEREADNESEDDDGLTDLYDES